MKKVYTIFIIKDKDIHVPSTDFYARNDAPQTDTVPMLQYWNHKDTEAEAEAYLLEHGAEGLGPEESYIILPTYIKA